jgi:thiosulfate/3-mercaptopyruvate sulfurtransferase
MLSPIVSADWLVEHRDEVVVADVRWYLDGRSGRDAYRVGHIPGAVWVDLETSLAAPATPDGGRHPLPRPETFAEGMAAAGIGDGTRVVAYDDLGGMVAGRLVWMLRALGQDAALLDGGLGAWPGPVEPGDGVTPEAATYTPRPWPEDLIASTAQVAQRPDGTLLFDARAPERYRGDTEPVDPRAGHIPGARNLPFAGNLGPEGRFRPVDELRARFAEAGVGADSDVIVYCGSGVSACHDVLAIEAAGGPRPRLYVGSWSAWSSSEGRPVATGDDAG